MNILVIANNQKTVELIMRFQQFTSARIHLASDYDLGLKDVFDKRPVALFIQDRIGEVSADVVAGHLKNLLKDESPLFVLLELSEEKRIVLPEYYDHSVDCLLSDQDILRHLREIFTRIPGLKWLQRQQTSAEIPADGADVSMPLPEMSRQDHEEFQFAPDSDLTLKTGSNHAGSGLATDADVEIKKRKAIVQADWNAGFGPSPVMSAGDGDDVIFSPEEFPPSEWNIREVPSKRGVVWKVATGLIATVVVATILLSMPKFQTILGGVWSRGTMRPVQAKSTVDVARPASAARQVSMDLPAVIDRKTRDDAYSRSHPGWERYVTDTLEFLVFRENGAIRAVQVIAAKKCALADGIMNGILQETCGTHQIVMQPSDKKDGYRIDKGTVGGRGEIEMYTRLASGDMRGFVLSFPSQ